MTMLLALFWGMHSPVASAAAGKQVSEDEEMVAGGDAETSSVIEELEKGIELLVDQIAKTERQLATAKAKRERQFIHEQLQFLRNERRSLEHMHHLLVGPRVDVREAAREQQSEIRSERYEKTLEQRSSP